MFGTPRSDEIESKEERLHGINGVLVNIDPEPASTRPWYRFVEYRDLSRIIEGRMILFHNTTRSTAESSELMWQTLKAGSWRLAIGSCLVCEYLMGAGNVASVE